MDRRIALDDFKSQVGGARERFRKGYEFYCLNTLECIPPADCYVVGVFGAVKDWLEYLQELRKITEGSPIVVNAYIEKKRFANKCLRAGATTVVDLKNPRCVLPAIEHAIDLHAMKLEAKAK